MHVQGAKWRPGRCAATGGVALWVALVTGCGMTQQVKVSNDQNSCAFLGSSLCAKLTPSELPGAFSQAALTGVEHARPGLAYVNPNANWTQYSKVIVAPVTFWASDNTSVSPADQQMLTEYFQQTLQQQLSTKFELVSRPGRGVMTIQVALDDASGATPILRTVSMLVPQARALVTLKYAATGTYAFVGSAQAEIKVVDSQTHQVLAAAVDRRVGGGSLATAAQWQWGDAENAMTTWAQQVTNRLSAWTSGTPPSP